MFWLAMTLTVMAACSAAQTSPASPASSPQDTTPPAASAAQPEASKAFPSGTLVPIELSKSLDAKKVKVNDKIEAKLPADLLSKGRIVIPRNAKVIGHVTDVKAHSKESPDSKVGIAFDRLILKDGREVQIQLVVQAISRPLLAPAPMDSHMNEGAGMPSGVPSTAGGTGMDASSSGPSRAPERVPSTTTDPSANTPPPSTSAPLAPTSQGVVGMKGLELTTSGQASVVSSQTDNVHLESGTQMILRTL
jgi:hypothetical protein